MTEGAADYDLASTEETVVPAKGKTVVKMGISIATPEGCYGRIAPRSGLAVQKYIDVGARRHRFRLEICQARNGKETGKERVLSFPVPPFLGTRFFPVSGQNHEKKVKNEAERPKNGRKDVERQRTAVLRRSKL